jgi:hypothetical protein
MILIQEVIAVHRLTPVHPVSILAGRVSIVGAAAEAIGKTTNSSNTKEDIL